MSKPIRMGIRVVWGVPKEVRPITGLPQGKVRICLSGGAVGRAFVRTADGFKRFVLTDNGETWGLLEQVRRAEQ